MSELDASVELLDRALAYTRVALADVRSDLLSRRTPCAGWSLGALLAHMEDALDAFTESAGGFVVVDAVPPGATRVEALRDKACLLLGAWAVPRPAESVLVGDLQLAGSTLVGLAALEITVHGWDVAQATGRGTPLPPDLATALLPVARALLEPRDRRGRFAAPLTTASGAGPGARLLAFLGRSPDPGEGPGDDPGRAIVTPGGVSQGRAS